MYICLYVWIQSLFHFPFLFSSSCSHTDPGVDFNATHLAFSHGQFSAGLEGTCTIPISFSNQPQNSMRYYKKKLTKLTEYYILPIPLHFVQTEITHKTIGSLRLELTLEHISLYPDPMGRELDFQKCRQS